ncbi:MAG: iron ABC transporter permease [Flavobacteriales bacterium]|nr:iron ABC transporter permease [Flavobacteriales bacterium]
MQRSPWIIWPVLFLALFVTFLLHLVSGPVDVPFGEAIAALFDTSGEGLGTQVIRKVRVPEGLTAVVVGAALGACGVMMQTLFGNPLAGPGVLGVTSGAGLGVALVMLASAGASLPGLSVDALVVAGASCGSFGVLLLILWADRRLQDGVSLLIVGLMVGYFCSALISILEVAAGAEALKGYVLWGMGTFAAVGPDRSPLVFGLLATGCVLAMGTAKPLDAMQLGETYAATMGLQVSRTRTLVVVLTGCLAGVATAFCGPIAFLGLATPHVARGLFGRSDHRFLIPATMLLGSILALLCATVVRSTGPVSALPLNAVTALLGVPVVVWVLIRGRRWMRMG